MNQAALNLLSVALLAAGLALGAWALFSDSWRRRANRDARRCPKCWFDLSHTNGRRCTECGFEANHERQLHRARRRWRWALLALVLLIGAGASSVAPAVRERGWVAAVPDTALIAAMPEMDWRWDKLWISSAQFAGRTNPWGNVSVDSLTWRERLFLEFMFRVDNDGLSRSEGARVLKRCVRGADGHRPMSPEWNQRYGELMRRMDRNGQFQTWELVERARNVAWPEFHTRAVWPDGAALCARIYVTTWNGLTYGCRLEPQTREMRNSGAEWWPAPARWELTPVGWSEIWDDHRVELGIAPGGETKRLEYLARPLRGSAAHPIPGSAIDVSAPVSWAESIDEVMAPTPCAPIAEALQEKLAASVLSTNLGHFVHLPIHSALAGVAPSDGLTLALKVEVRFNEAIVGTGAAWWRLDRNSIRPEAELIELEWRPEFEPPAHVALDDETAAAWSARLTGDQAFALRDFGSNRCWSGAVTVPANRVRREEVEAEK